MHYLRLLSVFYRTSIQTDIEYRADFFTRLIASLLGLLTTIGSLSIAYQYAQDIKGWSFPQAMTLLAVYYLMDGLIEMLIAPNMREIMRTINLWRAANVLVGVGLSIYAVQSLSLTLGLWQAVAFGITLLCGMAVIYSFWLVLVTLTFWFVRIDNLEQIIWQAFETGRYPVEIYPAWLRTTLTYVIPVVFIITVPASMLTGRIPPDAALVAVVISSAALAAGSAFWRFGLRHYTGASA
jgi:ABC-2 type transport system permease protein